MRRFGSYRSLSSSGNTPSAPPAPLSISPTPTNVSIIQVNFPSSATAETHIERSLTGVGAWSEIGIVAATGTFYSDTGRTRNTKYFYRARRKQNGLFSDYSPVNFTWPVDTLSINYLNGNVGFTPQQEEINNTDIAWSYVVAFGVSNLEILCFFSPTFASAVAWNYVLSQNMNLTGATWTQAGLIFNNDGFIDTLFNPSIIIGEASPSNFMMFTNVDNQTPNTTSNTWNMFAGTADVGGNNELNLGVYNFTGTDYFIVGTSGTDLTNVGVIDYGTNYPGDTGITIYAGGAGGDLASGDSVWCYDGNTYCTSSGYGSWPTGGFNLWIGAQNNAGTTLPGLMCAGTMTWFSFGNQDHNNQSDFEGMRNCEQFFNGLYGRT